MNTKQVILGLRLSETAKEKLQYIAEHNGRSILKEAAAVLSWYIGKFEQKHGAIKVKLAQKTETNCETIDNGGMSMYESKYTCPDCGNTLMMAWRWPEVILGRPVRLVFICKHCNGEIKEIPESSTVIYSSGRNVLDRHIDVYNQAVPFMAEGYRCIQPEELQYTSKPAVIAYKQGLTAGHVSA